MIHTIENVGTGRFKPQPVKFPPKGKQGTQKKRRK